MLAEHGCLREDIPGPPGMQSDEPSFSPLTLSTVLYSEVQNIWQTFILLRVSQST